MLGSWLSFLLGACGPLAFSGGGTFYVVVGAGGLPYQQGCVRAAMRGTGMIDATFGGPSASYTVE